MCCVAITPQPKTSKWHPFIDFCNSFQILNTQHSTQKPATWWSSIESWQSEREKLSDFNHGDNNNEPIARLIEYTTQKNEWAFDDILSCSYYFLLHCRRHCYSWRREEENKKNYIILNCEWERKLISDFSFKNCERNWTIQASKKINRKKLFLFDNFIDEFFFLSPLSR